MKKPFGPIATVVLVLCAVVFGYLEYHEYNINQGREAWRHYGCAQCHESGAAPDLTKLENKLDRATMARFIENPESVYRELGRRPLNQGYVPMPELHVSRKEAQQLADFLAEARP